MKRGYCLNSIQDIKNAEIERYSPSLENGLNASQVKKRMEQGAHNIDNAVKTKSIKEIIFSNTFTFFNTLNILFALLLISVGFWQGELLLNIFKNLLFMGVIFSNIFIGSFQEIRSKKIIDKLSVISAPKANVLRDGSNHVCPVCEVVLDDLLVLNSGNQICSDSIVVEGEIEVNESLITGESDPISKTVGDELLSGSFVVSGQCKAKVEHVGEDNYAYKIAADAKYLKKPNSEIVKSLDLIVKFIGFSIIPLGIILFSKQYFLLGEDSLYQTVASTVAALIGMIPEGLVLLTSVVFAVSVIRLAFHKTLVQELYCIETLARVDVLCLDKTGTITEGVMQVDEVIVMKDCSVSSVNKALAALSSNLHDESPTFNAVKNYSNEGSLWTCTGTIPFSSQRKYSAASFKNKGTYILGAGEFILGERYGEIKEEVEKYSDKGQRVLVLASTDSEITDKEIIGDKKVIAFVLISDKIRKEAPETLRYFAEQGVDLKVISGDNAVTVSYIAKKAGLSNADEYIDATLIKTDEEIEEAVCKYAVFGRVTPEQKLKFVKALKKAGHTVAMTGDGVNDVLALKESDCSIAMASGSDAARTVSNLVLMDSNFSSMPKVLKEGRRSINNLQRSATLFLSKTIYSILMTLFFIFVPLAYPFEPIHLTFISTLTIGIPSFVLALEPNKELVRGHFLINVIKKAIPTGVTIFGTIVAVSILSFSFDLTYQQFSSLSVLCTAILSMTLLVRLCYPFNLFHILLVAFLSLAMVVAVIFFGSFLEFAVFDLTFVVLLLSLSVISTIFMYVFSKLLKIVLIKLKV